MKKLTMALSITIAAFSFGGCSEWKSHQTANVMEIADSLNGWKVGTMTDQFGDPTGNHYLYNTFDDCDPGITVKCEYVSGRIELTFFKDGNKISDSGTSEIDIKDELGNISHFYANSNEGMSFSTADTDSILSLFTTNNQLKAAARFTAYGKGQLVSFRMKGTKHLGELLKQTE